MHKKSKDSKNSSVAVQLNSKTVEEKKGAPREAVEETENPSPEPRSEDSKPQDTEPNSAAEESNPLPEQTITETTGKGECPISSENVEEGENQSKDLENPENTSCHDEVVSQWMSQIHKPVPVNSVKNSRLIYPEEQRWGHV